MNDNLDRLAPGNAAIGLTWIGEDLSITTEIVGYARQDNVSSYNAEQVTPGYGLVNSMLVFTPSESLRLEARIENLLDRAYQDHVAGINRARGSDLAVGERLYGAGRSLSAGVIFRF